MSVASKPSPMMLMPDPQPSGAFEWTQEPWGRALRCTRLPAPHLFTSRDLVLRGDEGEWASVASSLGVEPARLLLVKQVHGVHVALARRGRTDGWTRPEADAIVTDDPDVAIGVRVADCAPVLLFDPVKHVAGAAHAGWRGTRAGPPGGAGSRPRGQVCLEAVRSDRRDRAVPGALLRRGRPRRARGVPRGRRR